MGTRQIGLRDIENTRRPRRLRLLAPLRYLAIQAPEKRFYDITLPAFVGVVGWLGYNLLDPKPPIFGQSGVLVTAQSFLLMAVPFLIGALAAVSMGSPGTHLDRRAVGAGIVLEGETLTLRQFVSYLLGYLCFLGLAAFIAVSVAIYVQPSISRLLPLEAANLAFWIEQIGAGVMMLWFSAFSLTVFWALYFLTDIVNRHE